MSDPNGRDTFINHPILVPEETISTPWYESVDVDVVKLTPIVEVGKLDVPINVNEIPEYVKWLTEPPSENHAFVPSENAGESSPFTKLVSVTEVSEAPDIVQRFQCLGTVPGLKLSNEI